ncbi:MAG TPA: hypothetical protein VED22_03470 [Nitrososphaerales archaeon]|nr:hypothetical protein [Nitrososphaerales archaeon]
MAGPVTKTYKVSKTFKAPLAFCYAWCTDFRADDYKMTGSKTRRHFLEQSRRRFVWVATYKEGRRTVEGIRAVWLKAPDAWHLDTCGDGREIGDYKLTPVGRGTRLDMVFRVTYDDPKKVEGVREWVRDTRREWDTFGRFLEADYKASVGKGSSR